MGRDKGGRTKDPAIKLLRAERRQKALQMRLDGHSLQAIGNALGISQVTAHILIEKELAKIPQASADRLRQVELGRLDELQLKALELLKLGDPEMTGKAIESMLKVMGRRAKLLGLDAPEKVDATYQVSGDVSPAKAREVMASVFGGGPKVDASTESASDDGSHGTGEGSA